MLSSEYCNEGFGIASLADLYCCVLEAAYALREISVEIGCRNFPSSSMLMQTVDCIPCGILSHVTEYGTVIYIYIYSAFFIGRSSVIKRIDSGD